LIFMPADRFEDMVLAPDRESVLFQKHDPVDPPNTMRLTRAALSGGGEQEIFRGKAFRAACASSAKGSCVLAEISPDNSQLFFSRLDPFEGKGKQLGSIQKAHANEVQWAISQDGARVAIFQPDAPDFDVLWFRDQRLRHVEISGGAVLRSLTWSTGDALYATSMTREGPDLLSVNLNGKSTKVWHLGGNNAYLRVVTSPDRKQLALNGSSKSSNMWILEDF
jgi:hypothetical protein